MYEPTREFDTQRPIYLQLMESVKNRIISGEYPPGYRLPSVRDMAGAESVNPNTMLRTLSELEREGLLTSQRTAGKSVTEDTELIGRLRGQTAAALTGDYLTRMYALGFTGEQIKEFLANSENNKGGAVNANE